MGLGPGRWFAGSWTVLGGLALAVAGVEGIALWSSMKAESVAMAPIPFTGALPPPTELRLALGSESENKSARKAWYRERHRAPDEVDYRQIERMNGRAQLTKRNRLATSGEWRDGAGTWLERGSENQAGRMHVAVHSPDGRSLYGGSALGGVFRGTLDGTDWEPISDNLYGGAHQLVVLEAELGAAPILLAATDWGRVHRSADDGLTWSVPVGLDDLWQVRTMARLGDTVFLAMVDGNEDHGVMRSDDAGATFDLVLDTSDYPVDVWIPRDGDETIYALADGALWVSGDLGDTWDERGTVADQVDRVELRGSEAGAPTLYAVITAGQSQTLYRSDDAGFVWTEVHDVTDYWGTLSASITDPDLVAWGGVEVWVSRDGGESFDIVNSWGAYYQDPETQLHADIPGLDVVPDGDGEIWYVSTDGGLYRSFDGLQTVQNLSLDGLRVSQYYDTHTSTVPPYRVAAGAQDQGYQIAYAEQDDDLFEFDQWISGDYGHLVSGDGSHDWLFSVYPGFPGTVLIQQGESGDGMFFAAFPEGENYAWMPPLVADPYKNKAFFFLTSHLYRYELSGGEWRPQLYTDHVFERDPGEYLSGMAFSPVDPERAYAVTNYGRLWWSEDHGLTWKRGGSQDVFGHYFYGTAIAPSPSDRDVAYIGGSGYAGPALFRTDDGGDSWTAWSNGLPDTLVYDVAVARDGTGRVFAATETAAYMRHPDDDEWTDITDNDAPVTIYWSVEALSHENTMRFGTYGRGIWDYQLPLPLDLADDCFPVHDADGDFATCDWDCDDADPTRSPLADDACEDGFDADCDGVDPDCVAIEEEERPGGCACSVESGSPVGWLFGGVVGMIAVFRRRSGSDSGV